MTRREEVMKLGLRGWGAEVMKMEKMEKMNREKPEEEEAQQVPGAPLSKALNP